MTDLEIQALYFAAESAVSDKTASKREYVIALTRKILQLAAPVAAQELAHADDLAVDRFAAAMKAKMAASRAKGRDGWDNPELCPVERLQSMLIDHLAKGDPVDVGNFAMMLFNRAAPVAAPAPGEPITHAEIADALDEAFTQLATQPAQGERQPCFHTNTVTQKTGDGTPVEFCRDCGTNRA